MLPELSALTFDGAARASPHPVPRRERITGYGAGSVLLSPVPAALDQPAHRLQDRAQTAFGNQQFPAVVLQGQRPGPPCVDLIGGALAAAPRAEPEPGMGNPAMSQR